MPEPDVLKGCFVMISRRQTLSLLSHITLAAASGTALAQTPAPLTLLNVS